MSANPYRVDSVDRAMLLLTLLLEKEQLSATEAASELGVATSTAHRILATMCDRGFVTQCAKRLYHPGPELLRPRASWVSHQLLASRLRPILQGLFDVVGETVHLMMLSGSDVRFVDGVEGNQGLRVGLRIGMVIPAYCTSGGKALLAELDDESLVAVHPGGLRPWPGRHVRTLEELRRELVHVKQQGFAANQEESESGVAALGAAVCGPDGAPLVGVAVAMPTARFTTEVEQQVCRHLLEARARANAALSSLGSGSARSR